jgi:hypothetical protein
VLSFHVSTMCGLRPKARQIRETDDCDSPVWAAIVRVDQCMPCPAPGARRRTIFGSTTKDPATKLFAIASGLDRQRSVLLAEVDNCQLLCGPHHVEKTADDEPYPNRARGERHGQAKLTAIDVADMRTANGVSGSVLADAFGVSKTQVNRIRAGKYWRHL